MALVLRQAPHHKLQDKHDLTRQEILLDTPRTVSSSTQRPCLGMCIGAVLLSTGCNQSMSYAVKELVIPSLAVSVGLFCGVQVSTLLTRVPVLFRKRNILFQQSTKTVQGLMPTLIESTFVLPYRTSYDRVSRTRSLLSMEKFGIVVLKALAVNGRV